MTSDIISMLTNAANTYGVPPELAIAVAQQESGGNPNAVSSAGAQGVMQLMPNTAANLGVTDPFDPSQNINAGVQYLSQLLSQFGGNTELALAAYNWGPGNVSNNGYSNWPSETMNYVDSIMSQIGETLSGQASALGAPNSGMSFDLSSWTPTTTELMLMAAAGGLILFFVMR